MDESSTWKYLGELGFETSDETAGTPQVKKDFGTFVLRANLTMNKYFREAVIFYANYVTSHVFGEIEFELSPNLASREQSAAMIYYYLRSHDVAKPPSWFDEAQANQHLLPWIATRKKADSRVVIPIRTECRPGKQNDGSWWDIVELIDDRSGLSLGDCGIYEFDADIRFPDGVTEYVLNILGSTGEFEDKNAIFIVDLTFMGSGIELASFTNRFRHDDTLNWPFRKAPG